MNFRNVNPCSGTRYRRTSSVQLLKVPTTREIYNRFVQTGEVPRMRSSGFIPLDYPIPQYGDSQDAEAYLSALNEQLRPAQQPIQQSAQQPIQQSAQQPIQQPVQQPVQRSVNTSSDLQPNPNF